MLFPISNTHHHPLSLRGTNATGCCPYWRSQTSLEAMKKTRMANRRMGGCDRSVKLALGHHTRDGSSEEPLKDLQKILLLGMVIGARARCFTWYQPHINSVSAVGAARLARVMELRSKKKTGSAQGPLADSCEARATGLKQQSPGPSPARIKHSLPFTSLPVRPSPMTECQLC